MLQEKREPRPDWERGLLECDQLGGEIEAKYMGGLVHTQDIPCTDDSEISVEIERLIGDLLDAQSRKRIADMWITGWVLGDEAMRLLIDLNIIESTPGAAHER